MIDSAKIDAWPQVTGRFGLVGSLLFVGLQIKQDR